VHVSTDYPFLTSTDTLPDNRALTSLDVSNNDIGQLVLPEGWSEKNDFFGTGGYKHTDGREQKDNPGKPEGIIAIANAIPDLGALSSLNLALNSIGGYYTRRGYHDEKFHPTPEGKQRAVPFLCLHL
jgi:hypothetical protein